VRHAVQLDGLKDVTVTVKDGRREKDRRVLGRPRCLRAIKRQEGTQHRETKREKPKSNVELLMEREMAKKQAAASAAADGTAAAAVAEKREKDGPTPWLCKGIVVKVLSPSLKDHGYWKKKGVVVKVSDGGFLAEIEMLNSGDVVRVDQAELETVVPGVGKAVMVVKGATAASKGRSSPSTRPDTAPWSAACPPTRTSACFGIRGLQQTLVVIKLTLTNDTTLYRPTTPSSTLTSLIRVATYSAMALACDSAVTSFTGTMLATFAGGADVFSGLPDPSLPFVDPCTSRTPWACR
jgi:hypothetical protein